MADCLIIYHSYFHKNTEKIASAMAEAIGAELRKADEIKVHDLSAYKTIGLGGGIAYHKHYEKLLSAVSELDLTNKDVFVFSTSGTGSIKQNAALVELLEKKGAKMIGNFSCRGFDTYGFLKHIGGIAKGHPNDKDLEKAKQFILGIVK
jgi:flavodoxin